MIAIQIASTFQRFLLNKH